MATATKKGQEEEKITALYARLSDDDPDEEKKKGKSGEKEDKESNSIQNQREILYDYARKNGYLHPQFFYDDGVSGTTFEREGFQKMEKLVEAGKVSTIIVKDLSRFGRNYLEVGNYLEMVYPSLGVKFIAIQENVDTLAGTGTEMMPFHNIFNEWYAAQTSKKIKAVWAMSMCQARVGKDSIRLRILFAPVFPLPSAQPDFRKRLVARYRLEPGQIRDGCAAPAFVTFARLERYFGRAQRSPISRSCFCCRQSKAGKHA